MRRMARIAAWMKSLIGRCQRTSARSIHCARTWLVITWSGFVPSDHRRTSLDGRPWMRTASCGGADAMRRGSPASAAGPCPIELGWVVARGDCRAGDRVRGLGLQDWSADDQSVGEAQDAWATVVESVRDGRDRAHALAFVLRRSDLTKGSI